MSIPDEEEKGEDLEIAAKEILTKLKLVEGFTKAIDRLVSLSTSDKAEFFLSLNSQVFSTIKKYLDLITGLNPKSWATFASKTIVERALKA
jgi:hypothetical protein